MKPCSLLSLMLAVALLCAPFQPVQAARGDAAPALRIIYVKANATGANNGTSWQDAYLTLTDALVDAGQPTGDAIVEVYVAAGTYYPTSGNDRTATFWLKNYLFIYGGFAGVEGETLETRNFVLNETILSGEIGDLASPLDNSYSVVSSKDFVNWRISSLDGFTIAYGMADGATPETRVGAGVHFYKDASPALTNLVITRNYATDAGGGLYSLIGMPQLKNVFFDRNFTDGLGGGIYAEDVGDTTPQLLGLTCQQCTFSSNQAVEGGAIYAMGSPQFDISDSTFSENFADSGGAIVMDASSRMLIFDSSFDKNESVENGGAITAAGDLTISTSQFSGSKTTLDGGAIVNSGKTTIRESTFTNNSAYSGGAIYNTGQLRIYASTFSGNEAVGPDGGGTGGALDNDQGFIVMNGVLMYNNTSDAGGAIFGICGYENFSGDCNHSLTLINVTMSGNHTLNPNSGAMMAIYDPPYIANSLLWGNDTRQVALDTMNPEKTVDIRASFIQGWTNDPDKNVFGDAAHDPLFVNAPGNDFHLRSGSPAFDMGDKTLLDSFVNYDLDGNPRIVGLSVDLGVYEQVNHAPTLLKTQFEMPPVWYAAGGNGVAVADLVKDAITDVDPSSLQGIAIIKSSRGEWGLWQFSVDDGQSWRLMESPTFFGVWVLSTDPGTRIRFVPSETYTGSVSLTFRAWDQTDNVRPGTGAGNVTYKTPGGSSSYSAELATLTVQVGKVVDHSISLSVEPDPVRPGEAVTLIVTVTNLETTAFPQRTVYLNLPPLVIFDPERSDPRCTLLPDPIGSLPNYTRVMCLVDLPGANGLAPGGTLAAWQAGTVDLTIVANVSRLVPPNSSLSFSAALLPDPFDDFQEDNQETLDVSTTDWRIQLFLPAIQK